MKKVLYLTNLPTPYRVNFFNELGKFCELTVAYERRFASDRNEKWLSGKSSNFCSVFLRGLNYKTESALCLDILKMIKNENYDHIIVGGYSTPTGMLTILYLKFMKIKFTLNSDGGIIKNDSRIKALVKKTFISSAENWLSTGKVTNDYLAYYGANTEDIIEYPFTSLTETDLLKSICNDSVKKEIRESLKIKEENVILFVGQLIHRKGIDLLLKAVPLLTKPVGVYIIGGKPPKEYIDLLHNLSLDNVYFLDFMEKEMLSRYYLASDIFVLPTREDIWGLVINEAMSYGLPIITTNKCVAGVELVEDSINGYIIESDNVNQLINKCNKLLESSSVRRNFAQNNLNKISNYTIEKMCQVHLELINQ